MTIVESSPQYIKGADLKTIKDKIVFKPLSEFARGGKYDKIEGIIQVIAGETKFKAKWSCSDTVGNKLIQDLGSDTAEWIGKEIHVQYESINDKDSISLA